MIRKIKYSHINDKIIYPLLFNYDDYECGNALGSAVEEQKLGGVYISLPFLPPQIAFKHEFIFSAAIFYKKDRENFGNVAVFGPIIKDINEINEILSRHKSLDSFQAGFRKYHSTQSALIKFADDIRMGMDKKLATLLCSSISRRFLTMFLDQSFLINSPDQKTNSSRRVSKLVPI